MFSILKKIIEFDLSKIITPSKKMIRNIIPPIILIAILAGGATMGIKKYRSSVKAREQQTIDLITQQREESGALIASQQRELEDIKSKLTELEENPKVIYQTIGDTTPKELTVAQIAKAWSSQVVHVNCEWYYSSGRLYKTGSGSGFIGKFKNGIFQVVTNKHVILDRGVYTPRSCSTTFLNGEKYITNWDNGTNFGQSENFDVGVINIVGLSNNLKKIIANHAATYCLNKPDIGDKVVILGYPGIGSNSGITVTEGIISGYDGVYYVTSAKIDHGNSGGIAVSVKDNCIVGMPSASVEGALESLGRILSTKDIITQ